MVSSCLPACLVSVVRPPFDFYIFYINQGAERESISVVYDLLSCSVPCVQGYTSLPAREAIFFYQHLSREY